MYLPTSILALLFHLLCLSTAVQPVLADNPSPEETLRTFFNSNDAAGSSGSPSKSAHTNNWAVLVSASRYWFNYRHMANALGMYRTVKRLGIPDSNIILMLADDVACNGRNKFSGTVFSNPARALDLYGENIEVDYRGYEVTVENFIRVLTGRVDPSVPRSKRLLTDDRSNIFVYMTGHGGDEFLKFQDNEELSAFDIADAFEQMWQKKRYNEILFMIDTCQANSMYSKFYSPNILATGSSEVGENSYSHSSDLDIGVAVIDSFTHHVLQFMEGKNKTSHASMQDLFNTYSYTTIHSHAGVRADLFRRPLDSALITDFFGGVAQVEVLPAPFSPASSTRTGEGDEQIPFVPFSPLANANGVVRSGESNGSSAVDVGSFVVDRTSRSPSTLGGSDGVLAKTGRWLAVGVMGGLLGWVVSRR